jgi:hypothetical protein
MDIDPLAVKNIAQRRCRFIKSDSAEASRTIVPGIAIDLLEVIISSPLFLKLLSNA